MHDVDVVVGDDVDDDDDDGGSSRSFLGGSGLALPFSSSSSFPLSSADLDLDLFLFLSELLPDKLVLVVPVDPAEQDGLGGIGVGGQASSFFSPEL